MTIKFEVFNQFSGSVQFTAEIECSENDSTHLKLGLAVEWAIKSRANLSGADLYRANLSDANLSGADLSVADLSRANLSRANLSDANLSDANLSRANLSGADLSGADLSDADLSDANLSGADLYRANLSGANLSDANLSDANLSGANLSRADLSGADLYRADLSGANLTDAKDAALAIARTRILPDGDIIGWKRCRYNVLVKLRVPESAKRSQAFGRKCRAEYADVLEIIGGKTATSLHDIETTYRIGERIHPDSFDENWQNECSNGIHFFITREEAEAYS